MLVRNQLARKGLASISQCEPQQQSRNATACSLFKEELSKQTEAWEELKTVLGSIDSSAVMELSDEWFDEIDALCHADSFAVGPQSRACSQYSLRA